MTRDDVKQIVVSALVKIQTASGRTVGDIDESMRPIGDLEGFESLNVIELVVEISGALGHKIEPHSILERSAGRPPQLGEIINRICRQIGIRLEGKSV